MLYSLAILLANDLAITINQWLPFDSEYYEYYFVILSVMLVAIVHLGNDKIARAVATRTKFKSFMVLIDEAGTKSDSEHLAQPLLGHRDESEEEVDISGDPPEASEDVQGSCMLLQNRRDRRCP